MLSFHARGESVNILEVFGFSLTYPRCSVACRLFMLWSHVSPGVAFLRSCPMSAGDPLDAIDHGKHSGDANVTPGVIVLRTSFNRCWCLASSTSHP